MLSSIYDYTMFGMEVVVYKSPSSYRYSVTSETIPPGLAYLTVVTLFQVFVDATYLLTTACK